LRGEYQADQSAIWADISERASRRDAKSASMAMARIYEKDLPFLQGYLQNFRLVGYQVGAVFMINGEVVGMDAFGTPETFSKVFNKLVQSYALDAIDWIDGNMADELSVEDVANFKKGIFSCKLETHDSVGIGTDCRLESDKLTGFALALDGKVLHMSVFARLASLQGRSQTSRMARYSRRSRNRAH
jgi:hypothetical protein